MEDQGTGGLWTPVRKEVVIGEWTILQDYASGPRRNIVRWGWDVQSRSYEFPTSLGTRVCECGEVFGMISYRFRNST